MIAQDPRGNVFHGRNLDWNLPNEIRNTSFIVRTYSSFIGYYTCTDDVMHML